jgi:TolB-like protein
VLPLENLRRSVTGVLRWHADELITELGQIGELPVISYLGDDIQRRAGSAELRGNVDAVVEGTVLRWGDSVRITAQLILASNDKHLWAHGYEVGLAISFRPKQVARSRSSVRIK